MNQRLEQLYRLGVLRVRLEADKDGYPTFVAMPDAPLKFLVPTNYDRIINAFFEAMAQAKTDEVRAYAWTNVTRAAETVKKLLEWQLNADLLSAMNEAMNGFDSPADEEVRSEQEVN
ncbi:hypothetical protein FPHYL_831 [Fusarium phyllophilum]|uniref:Uncharacterized protein n=1 Tax=Fusarium phyllophilum TaxID=47803 RepID=A0A8H5NLJ1_9HYPO|nr:hypothetical protein FPHYL_831 [Fusarium phyllophilum]